MPGVRASLQLQLMAKTGTPGDTDSIDRGSTGSEGSIDPPLFQVGGQRTMFDPPLLMCTKHVFAAFESLSCTINAIDSAHYANIKMLLAYPTLAE